MEYKNCLADNNQVYNLRIDCCKAIVNYDLVEKLQPKAEFLSINVVKYLLVLFDPIQFGKFHTYYPKGALVERLFIEKYKDLCYAHDELRNINWHEFQKRNELEFYCRKYWSFQVSKFLRNKNRWSLNWLLRILTNVAYHVKRLDFISTRVDDEAFELISNFATNVRCISFNVGKNFNFENMFALAKTLKFLKKLKFNEFQNHPQLVSSLKDFLEYKARANERILISFIDFNWAEMYKPLVKLLTYLGSAMWSISGLTFLYTVNYHPDYRGEDLTVYPVAECTHHLNQRRVDGIHECLLKLISTAPTCASECHMLSKFRLERVQLIQATNTAYSHWRFSQLKHFHLSNVNVGYEGARILASHATFWPFVKRLILRDCQIPSKGFLLLLPAMVQGAGCENLAQLDFSENTCLADSFPAISMFLSSTNLTKLKAVRLFSIHDTPGVQSLPLSLLKGMQQLSLVYFDMSGIPLDQVHLYELLYSLLSKPNNQLLSISLQSQACSYEKIEQCWIEFKQRLNESGLSGMLPDWEPFDDFTLSMERGNRFLTFSSN